MGDSSRTRSAPPRPDIESDKWVTRFSYTDSLSSGGLSTPQAWDDKETAISQTDNAPAYHDGGGITVQAAYAWPPAGSDDDIHVVDFKRSRI